MNKQIYRGIIIPAEQSPDGETSTDIYLTEESNGFAIWRDSFEGGTVLLQYLRSSRHIAIEIAVRTADLERKKVADQEAANPKEGSGE